MSTTRLVEHFFRHEYGRLVASLVRRFGAHHIEAAEDAAQSAMMAALETWTRSEPPDNPSAWLFRVASNHLLGELRRHTRQHRLLGEGSPGLDAAPAAFSPGDVADDMLRLFFVCCDEAIPVASQLVLALKTLSGFAVHEIAERLFTSEANVYKRLTRARDRLREAPFTTDLDDEQIAARLPAVRQILYLLFTEGYLSSHAERAIRRELCDEARRLCTLLAHHPLGNSAETCALLALMHLHQARMGGRQDAAGGLLLLEEQDRDRWDPTAIHVGLSWLARSAEGDTFSRYHAEAGIAAEHCLAPSFAETRWDRVVACYALLERVAPSALHRLNRAVATAEWRGPAAGLAVLEDQAPPSWLAGSYLWAAVHADLLRRCGHVGSAERQRQIALTLAPSPAVRKLLVRRLALSG